MKIKKLCLGNPQKTLKGLSARNRLHKSHCCTSSVDRAPRDHANVTSKVAVSWSYLATLVEGYLDDAFRMPWKNWKALQIRLTVIRKQQIRLTVIPPAFSLPHSLRPLSVIWFYGKDALHPSQAHRAQRPKRLNWLKGPPQI